MGFHLRSERNAILADLYKAPPKSLFLSSCSNNTCAHYHPEKQPNTSLLPECCFGSGSCLLQKLQQNQCSFQAGCCRRMLHLI